MIWLNWDRWSASYGRWLILERMYWRGWGWTPFLRVRLRRRCSPRGAL